MKWIQIKKEETKFPLFAGNMIVYIEKLRNSYSKIYTEIERSENSKTILKKKNQVLEIIFSPSVKIHYIAVVTTMVWYWWIDRHIDRPE